MFFSPPKSLNIVLVVERERGWTLKKNLLSEERIQRIFTPTSFAMTFVILSCFHFAVRVILCDKKRKRERNRLSARNFNIESL